MIITDSASDILEDEARAMDVRVVPLDIMFGDAHFTRNAPDEFLRFYRMLEERSDFPTTSQPSPEAYLSLYREAQETDQDVLVVCLSGALSGTVESARMAASLSEWGERISIVDTRHAIASQRLMVETAVRMRNEGAALADIVRQLDDLRQRIRICGVLDKLEYLRRGGRIPSGLAVVGDLLSIKPVVAVDDGAVVPIGKARGRHAGEKRLRQEFERIPRDPAWPVMFLYSKDRQLVDEFASDFCQRFDVDPASTRTIQIGPTIGAHLGPDCVGLCFVAKDPIG